MRATCNSGKATGRRPLAHPGRNDGELGASAVEAALVLPVVLALLFAIVQGAVTLHAGTVASAVAQSTLEAARAYDAVIDDALAAGYATASATGTALDDVRIEITRTDTTVTVTVRGTAPSLVPGMPVHVERGATGPRERWVE